MQPITKLVRQITVILRTTIVILRGTSVVLRLSDEDSRRISTIAATEAFHQLRSFASLRMATNSVLMSNTNTQNKPGRNLGLPAIAAR